MKLHHGVRFLDLSVGALWELRTRNANRLWVCRAIRPACIVAECPQQLFKEFAEEEILEHILLDPFKPESTNVQDLKIELAHLIDEAVKRLPLSQQREVYASLAQVTKARHEVVCLRLGVNPEQS